jgi:hypothetical protein
MMEYVQDTVQISIPSINICQILIVYNVKTSPKYVYFGDCYFLVVPKHNRLQDTQ